MVSRNTTCGRARTGAISAGAAPACVSGGGASARCMPIDARHTTVIVTVARRGRATALTTRARGAAVTRERTSVHATAASGPTSNKSLK